MKARKPPKLAGLHICGCNRPVQICKVAKEFFPNVTFPDMLTAQSDSKGLPETSTLVPTVFSSRLRRYLTDALLFAACIGGPSALAVNCKIAAAYTPSEADQAFLHSDYDRAVTLYQSQLQQKPNDPALTAGLVQVFLRQQKLKEADEVVKRALTD